MGREDIEEETEGGRAEKEGMGWCLERRGDEREGGGGGGGVPNLLEGEEEEEDLAKCLL